jgi:predicted esterase
MKKKEIYLKWCVYKEHPEPTSCILALPGRGQSGFHMASTYLSVTNSPKTLIIGVTPIGFQWYPMPKGPYDQYDALNGLGIAVKTIDDVVNRIIEKYNIPADKISIVGYSAGGVMALMAAAHLPQHNFASITCHAGTVLSPDELPDCANTETELLICHSQDDNCFDWRSRYMPTREALRKKGYNVQFSERREGGHSIFYDDLKKATNIMESKFG